MSNAPNSTPPSQKPAHDQGVEKKTPQQSGETGTGAKQQGGHADSDKAKPPEPKR